MADCAEDTRTVIDALEVDRFAVWGVSGGGPHALACASLLGDRVVAAATLASPAPFDADGLDWWADTGQENIDDDLLVLNDPEAARAKLAKDRLEFFDPSEPDMARAHPTLFSPADAAVLTDELGDYLRRRNRTGLAPGIEGVWEDSVAMLKPWGFAVDTIQTPVMVWHGRQDRMVPFQHAEWLTRRLPSAEAHLSDDDGSPDVDGASRPRRPRLVARPFLGAHRVAPPHRARRIRLDARVRGAGDDALGGSASAAAAVLERGRHADGNAKPGAGRGPVHGLEHVLRRRGDL